MLSFGIEYDLAFSIAFWSARLPAGSPPPSFAATMIARESLENSFPRFASAAPFLCLIDDHLLCPDTHRLPYRLEEQLVNPRIFRELGMERGNEQPAVAEQDGNAVVPGQHLDAGTDVGHPRRTDEHAAQGFVLALELQIRLEARDLTPVRVPLHLEVGETEMVAVEDDHPRARSEHRP